MKRAAIPALLLTFSLVSFAESAIQTTDQNKETIALEGNEELSVDDTCSFLRSRMGMFSNENYRDTNQYLIEQNKREKEIYKQNKKTRFILTKIKDKLEKGLIGQNEADEIIWCFILGEKGASYVIEERGDSDKIIDLIAFYLKYYVSEGMKQKILDVLDVPYTAEDEQTMKSHLSDLGYRKEFIIDVFSRLSFSPGLEEKLIKCVYDKSQDVAKLAIALLGKNKSVKAIKTFEEVTEFYRNNPEADFKTSKDKTGYTTYRIEYIIDALGNYNDPQTLNLITELSKHKHFFKKEGTSALAKRKEESLVPALLDEFNNNEKLFYATIKSNNAAWKKYNRRLVEISKDLANYEGDPLVKERLYKFIISDIAKYYYKVLFDEHQGDFSYCEALRTLAKINGAKELILYLKEYEKDDDYVTNRVYAMISYLGMCDYQKLTSQEKDLVLATYQQYLDYLENGDGTAHSVLMLEKLISENLSTIPDSKAQMVLNSLDSYKDKFKHKKREYGYSKFIYNPHQDASHFLKRARNIDSESFGTIKNVNFFQNLRTSGLRIELPEDMLILLTEYSGKPTKNPFIRLIVKKESEELYSIDFKSKRLSFKNMSGLVPFPTPAINPELEISFQNQQITLSPDKKFLSFEIEYAQIYSGAKGWGTWWGGPKGHHQTVRYVLDVQARKLYKVRESSTLEE